MLRAFLACRSCGFRGQASAWLAANSFCAGPRRTSLLVIAILTLQSTTLSAPRNGRYATGQSQDSSGIEHLIVPGSPVEGEIGAGQVRTFRIRVDADQYVRLIIEHHGVELSIRLSNPDSNLIAEMEGPYGDRETKSVSIKADVDGDYKVELRVTKAPQKMGRFNIGIEGPRTPSEIDLTRMKGEQAFMAAHKQIKENTDKSRRKAIENYKQAVSFWRTSADHQSVAKALLALARTVWVVSGERAEAEVIDLDTQMQELCHQIGDRRGEAFALNHLGRIRLSSNPLRARVDLESALPIWRAEGDRLNEAITLNNIGGTYQSVGDMDSAFRYFSESLLIRQELKDQHAIANALNNIGQAYDRLGESHEALSHYQQVIDLLGETPSLAPAYLAAALNNTGYTYLAMGDPVAAVEYCNRSLPLQREANYWSGEIGTLLNLGSAHLQLGEPRKALRFYKEAQALSIQFDAKQEFPYSLTYAGEAYALLGKPHAALKEYLAALDRFKQIGAVDGEAMVLSKLGALFASNNQSSALNNYRRALAIFKEIRDPRGEAATLYGIARVERARGNLAEAHKQAEAAIKTIETLRARVVSREMRTSYLASVRDYYDLDIDLLMQLHKRHPLDGYNARALQLSELSRARSFLESLGEVGKEIREGVDPNLLDREQSLRRQIEAKIQLLVQVLKDEKTKEQAAQIDRDLKSLIGRRKEAEEKIRVQSPRYAALIQPKPIGSKEIQDEVLDPETLLLEYALGEKRSYLWLVSTSQIKSYELPGRAVIEAWARQVYNLVKSIDAVFPTGKAEFWKKASVLSQMILGPAAGQLGDKRLLIVTEGALQYVPFSALPIPRTTPRNKGSTSTGPVPMIAEHEIVSFPSVSSVAASRAELATRKHADKGIAVFADPVFERDDKRLQSVSSATSAGSSAGEPRLRGVLRDFERYGVKLDRLENSRAEADAIRILSPDAKINLDFDASRANARNAELGNYRILHFATHGLLNSNQPDLSCVALSMVDARGEKQDGFLLLNDIYNLRLSADLVVLSACSTALGKDIRGEGLVGLTRGFMYAGAARVMASLWNVDDQRTAELMKRFYEKVLKDRMQPSAALRAAQLEMWRSENNSPYYWGAFVLQGEWKDAPARGSR